MGRHTDPKRPSETTHVPVAEGYKMHEDWETTQDIEALREALRWQGSVTANQSDIIRTQGDAIRAVRALYLVWEQEFTGRGKLHDVVQGHVTDLREAIESNVGEDWY